MSSILNKNCILTGPVDSLCLVCEDHLRGDEDSMQHIAKPIHQKNLDATNYFDKYKDDHVWKVKKGYYCEYCNLFLKTSAKVGPHVSEARHCKRKSSRSLKIEGNSVIAFEKVFIPENAWHGLTEDTCCVCDAEFDNAVLHKAETAHILNLVLAEIEVADGNLYRKIDDSTFQCLTCNVVWAIKDMSAHFDGANHKEQYQKCCDSAVNVINEPKKETPEQEGPINKTCQKESPKTAKTSHHSKKTAREGPEPETSKIDTEKETSKANKGRKKSEPEKPELKKNKKPASNPPRLDQMSKMDKKFCDALGADDNYIASNTQGMKWCILCDWALEEESIPHHINSKHHVIILKMHREREAKNYSKNGEPHDNNDEELKCKEKPETSKVDQKAKSKSKIVDAALRFQKNNINLDVANGSAYCRLCSKSIDYDYDVIQTHIDEHKWAPKPEKTERKITLKSFVNSAEKKSISLVTSPVAKEAENKPNHEKGEESKQFQYQECKNDKNKVSIQGDDTEHEQDKNKISEHGNNKESENNKDKEPEQDKNIISKQSNDKESEQDKEKESKPSNDKESEQDKDKESKQDRNEVPKHDKKTKQDIDKVSKQDIDKETKQSNDKESKQDNGKESEQDKDKEAKKVKYEVSKQGNDKESKKDKNEVSKQRDNKETKPVKDKESKQCIDIESKQDKDKDSKQCLNIETKQDKDKHSKKDKDEESKQDNAEEFKQDKDKESKQDEHKGPKQDKDKVSKPDIDEESKQNKDKECKADQESKQDKDKVSKPGKGKEIEQDKDQETKKGKDKKSNHDIDTESKRDKDKLSRPDKGKETKLNKDEETQQDKDKVSKPGKGEEIKDDKETESEQDIEKVSKLDKGKETKLDKDKESKGAKDEETKQDKDEESKQDKDKEPKQVIKKKSKQEPSHGSPKEIEKYAQANRLNYNKKTNTVFCSVCASKIPPALQNMKEHINGCSHKNKVGKAKVEPVKRVMTKMSTYDFMDNAVVMEFQHLRDVVINEKYCLNITSFLMITKIGDQVRCQGCEVNLERSQINSHINNPIHERILDVTPVVTSEVSEFIREVRPGVYHCGYCNQLESPWSLMEMHLQSTAHREAKTSAFWRMQIHLPTIRQQRAKETMEFLMFVRMVQMFAD